MNKHDCLSINYAIFFSLYTCSFRECSCTIAQEASAVEAVQKSFAGTRTILGSARTYSPSLIEETLSKTSTVLLTCLGKFYHFSWVFLFFRAVLAFFSASSLFVSSSLRNSCLVSNFSFCSVFNKSI